MTSRDIVVVKTFPNEASALLAQAVLESNGIPSTVKRDDAGRAEPQLAYVRGVGLAVRAEDAGAAAALLAE